MRKFIAISLITLCHVAQAAGPNVLNNGTHAATFIAPAIVAVLGGGVVDSTIFVDRSSAQLTDANLLAQSSNLSATDISVASGNPVNHAVYGIVNSSTAGYAITQEPQTYTSIATQPALYVRPFAFTSQPMGTPPGVTLSTVSSPNSSDGASGQGIEFGLSASYKGLDTSADSWDSAELAGFFASLANQHPTWTLFDVKGALRQTAGNWATGYNPTTFGYGFLNWDSANALSSTSAIFLQPPYAVTSLVGNQISITIYPFRTTRRHHEVVYLVPAGTTWPLKNEFALTDITSTGATLVFTGNTTDLTPSGTLSLPGTPGTYQVIAFTTDNLGAYSRVESFSAITTPAIGCL